MRIKTFKSPRLADALSQIKKELGDEALILSTREVKSPGVPGDAASVEFEVVAANDSEESVSQESPRHVPYSPSPVNRRAREVYRNRTSSAPNQSHPPSADGIVTPPTDKDAVSLLAGQGISPGDPFLRELRELKRMVRWSAQSVPGARLRISDPGADALFVEMIANDVDESLARRIIAEAQERCGENHANQSLDQVARDVLAEELTISPIDESSDSQIVAALLGPTGVGKTTTLAKLASRFSLELGKKTVLVTLDTYRIGAAEQLRIYSDLVDLPLSIASTPQELDEVVRDHSNADIVLIDTVGRAPNQVHTMQDLAAYFRDRVGIEKHLVLSLGAKPLDLQEAINSFARFGTNKLLFTKLDETLTTGTAVNELFRVRKPLSYLANGQNVPQDIRIPTSKSLAELIIAKDLSEEVRRVYA